MDLFENWAETKAELLDGLSPRQQAIMDAVLEKQFEYLRMQKARVDAGEITNIDVVMETIRNTSASLAVIEQLGTNPLGDARVDKETYHG